MIEGIDTKLQKIGIKQSSSDGNMYYIHKKGETLILMINVDYLFITGSNPSLIQWLKNFLQNERNKRSWPYQEVSFKQVSKGLFLYQKDYTTSILRDFGM